MNHPPGFIHRSKSVIDPKARPVDRVAGGMQKIFVVPEPAFPGLVHRQAKNGLPNAAAIGPKSLAEKPPGGQNRPLGKNLDFR